MATRQSISASFTVRYAAEGTGIASVTTYYALSTSATAVTGTWSTTCPTMTAAYPYLWQYTVTVYTDGDSDTTDAVLIGHFGADGQDGADGADGADGPSYTFIPSSISDTTDGYEYSGSLSATLAAYDTGGNEVTIDSVSVKSYSSTTSAVSASTTKVAITPGSRSVSYGSSTGVTSGTVTASYTSGYVVLAITVNGSVFRHTISWSIDCEEAISTAYYGSSGISLLYTTVSDMEAGLLATGIDITNKAITATANYFTIQDNSGNAIMSTSSETSIYTTAGGVSGTVTETAVVFAAGSFVVQNSDGDTVANIDQYGYFTLTSYDSDDEGDLVASSWLTLQGNKILLLDSTGATIEFYISDGQPYGIGTDEDGEIVWSLGPTSTLSGYSITDGVTSTTTVSAAVSTGTVVYDSSTLTATYSVTVKYTNNGSSSVTLSSSNVACKVESAFGYTSLVTLTLSSSATVAAGSTATLTFEGTASAKSTSPTLVTDVAVYAYYDGELVATGSASVNSLS